jgi:integrase
MPEKTLSSTLKPHPGIEPRHGRSCPAKGWERCSCSPSYRAEVWSRRENRKIRRTFPTLAAAKSWRSDAIPAVRRNTLRTPTKVTLPEALDELVAGMEAGSIRASRKAGQSEYKPSTIRSYSQASERLKEHFGSVRLADVARNDLQDLIDRLVADGAEGQTVRNVLMPLRVVVRRAIKRGELTVNPTADLDLPASDGARERVASAAEAVTLLDALPEADRALWATAIYAGLRAGELQALQVEDVDLEAGVIHVRQSWDRVSGFVGPKSRAGARQVPICQHLRAYLEAHEAPEAGFYFGRVNGPFDYWSALTRARKAWDEAEAERLGLHEARHSYASFLDAAGITGVRADRYMGHASHGIHARYRHSLAGQLAEDAARLDAYLTGAEDGTVVRLWEAS